MIGAGKPDSRKCPVVLDPTVAASFVGLLGGALGADAVQRGRSPFAGRLGDEVAGEAFVLHDDGLDPGRLRHRPDRRRGAAPAPDCADRGRPPPHLSLRHLHGAAWRGRVDRQRRPRRVPLATMGLGLQPPRRPGSARPSTACSPRPEGGVWVTDVAGLHSGVNPVSGVFSVGASGRAIRDGALAEPLREFTIASDLVSMLRAVAGGRRVAALGPVRGLGLAPRRC